MATGTDVTRRFAERLDDLVYEKKKSSKNTKDIAAESGVPSGSLSKYQNDSGEAGINSLVKLAKYFSVSTDYLLGLTDIPCGNADDMAISKRLGINSKTISELSRFIDEEDGDSTFLNLLSDVGFWDILLGLNYSFINYIQAMSDELYTFRDTPEDRLRYTISQVDYQPVRNEDALGFTLDLTAEHYFEFCLQQASTKFVELMKATADELIGRVTKYEGFSDSQITKKRKPRQAKKETNNNG